MEREGRQLEADADEQEQHAEDQHGVDRRFGREHGGKALGQVGEITGAELAREQADAVKHHPGSAAAVNHILQGRFTALPPSFQKAGQSVAGQARHFDSDEHHQQVIGRCHQEHAERAAQEQHIEVAGILGVGNAGQERKDHRERRGAQDDAARVDEIGIVNCHAGKGGDVFNCCEDQPAAIQ